VDESGFPIEVDEGVPGFFSAGEVYLDSAPD